MIATRYLPAVCLLVMLALVPTIIHSYSGDVTVDGRDTTRIASTLAEYSGTPTTRADTWGKRRFDSDDWIERTYANPRDSVRLTVVRSYDPKSVYHHPELAIAYGTSFEGLETRRLPSHPDIPVHVLRRALGVDALAMYVLHYDGRFVDDPVLFQIRTAGELLFTRRKPMTLFFAFDADARQNGEVEQLGATRVLFAAIDSFLSQDVGSSADAR